MNVANVTRPSEAVPFRANTEIFGVLNRAFLRWVLASPRALISAELRCRWMGQFYDRVLVPAAIQPIVTRGTPLDRAVRSSIRGYALRVAFFIQNYANMAGGGCDTDMALLCGVFGHVYDHCIDAGLVPADQVPALLDDLRAGRYRDASTPAIRLMQHLYAEYIRTRFPEPRYRLLHEAFERLHRLQVLSLDQTKRESLLADIRTVTCEKGAAATMIFCAAGRPDLTPREALVVERRGALFQFFDDFEDRYIDSRTGVRTVFTEGVMDRHDLWRELVAVAGDVNALYDGTRPATEEFVQGLYSWYVMACADAALGLVGIPLERVLRLLFAMGDLLPNAGRTRKT